MLFDATTAGRTARIEVRESQGRYLVTIGDRVLDLDLVQTGPRNASLIVDGVSHDLAIESGALSGFEALVRWNRPQRGFIQPGDFLGLAEETGLIVQIDRWVMREACRQLREWHQKFPQHAHCGGT